MLKIFGLVAVMTMSAVSVGAQTVDEIIAHYIKAVGGMDKIESIRTLRRTGKWFGGGGFEAVIVQENKRDSSVREEFSLQGMTAKILHALNYRVCFPAQ